MCNHCGKPWMNRRIKRTRRDGIFVNDFVYDGRNVLSGKRLLASHQFVEDHAQGKNVGSSIDRFAFYLFRRHVRWRPHNMRSLSRAKLQNFCSAEVSNLDGVIGSQHKVRGLDVGMSE